MKKNYVEIYVGVYAERMVLSAKRQERIVITITMPKSELPFLKQILSFSYFSAMSSYFPPFCSLFSLLSYSVFLLRLSSDSPHLFWSGSFSFLFRFCSFRMFNFVFHSLTVLMDTESPAGKNLERLRERAANLTYNSLRKRKGKAGRFYFQR